jgi:hypothetical protein
MQEFDPKLMLARKGEVVELLGEAFALPGSRHRPVCPPLPKLFFTLAGILNHPRLRCWAAFPCRIRS